MGSGHASQVAAQEQPDLAPRVSRSIKNDVSPPLREIKPKPFAGEVGDVVEMMADRWVISQFAFSSTSVGPYYQCFAVWTTPDPTGSYFRYGFVASNVDFNDYPNVGVWPDGYYATYVRFQGGTSFVGQQADAHERAAMLTGAPAQKVSFNIGTIVRGLLPTDLDGDNLPPASAPNVHMDFNSSSAQIEWWKFSVNWTTPGTSTFVQQPAGPSYRPRPIGRRSLAEGMAGRPCHEHGAGRRLCSGVRY